MIVSLEWLKDYTDVQVSPETFCDRMIMSGSNLETMEIAGEGITNVVVGRIEKIEKHPDADKLVVCSLNIGDKAAEGKSEETGLLLFSAHNQRRMQQYQPGKEFPHLPQAIHNPAYRNALFAAVHRSHNVHRIHPDPLSQGPW